MLIDQELVSLAETLLPLSPVFSPAGPPELAGQLEPTGLSEPDWLKDLNLNWIFYREYSPPAPEPDTQQDTEIQKGPTARHQSASQYKESGQLVLCSILRIRDVEADGPACYTLYYQCHFEYLEK